MRKFSKVGVADAFVGGAGWYCMVIEIACHDPINKSTTAARTHLTHVVQHKVLVCDILPR
jgi:hypothetical protein